MQVAGYSKTLNRIGFSFTQGKFVFEVLFVFLTFLYREIGITKRYFPHASPSTA